MHQNVEINIYSASYSNFSCNLYIFGQYGHVQTHICMQKGIFLTKKYNFVLKLEPNSTIFLP